MRHVTILGTSLGLVLLSGLLSSSCGANLSDQCEYHANCPPGGAGGGGGTQNTSGTDNGGKATGGAETTGGEPMSGGRAGSSGEPNAGAGAGGEGGVMTPLPCDGPCPSDQPVCKPATDECVECLQPSHCTTATKTQCDLATNTCVECLAPTDCADAKLAKCEAGACVKCTTNDDCAHIADRTVCDTTAGECVQCTGKDYAACGNDTGTPLVCDSLKRTCSTSKEKSAELCDACVSDAQCSAGELCVKETFGAPAQDVGYFCFWKKGDTANGAPTACLSEAARPYAATLTDQTSVDGVVADICGLATSSCTARRQFRTEDCATASAADDQKCGFAPAKDSKCVQADVGVFLCTMACLSDLDCPGVACKSGPAPRGCNFQ
jgi:hypothetical protein